MRAKLNLILIGAILGLLILGGGYVVGLSQGRGELNQQRESMQHLLRAQGSLYKAAIELDRRNFGTANDYVRQAETGMKAVDPTGARVDEQQYSRLIREIESTSLIVASDLESQRARVLELAASMEAPLQQAQ